MLHIHSFMYCSSILSVFKIFQEILTVCSLNIIITTSGWKMYLSSIPFLVSKLRSVGFSVPAHGHKCFLIAW